MEAQVAALPAQSSVLSAQTSPKKNTVSQPPPRNTASAAQESLERPISANPAKNTVTTAHITLDGAITAPSPKSIVTAAQESLEKAITAFPTPAPRYLLKQNSLEKSIKIPNPQSQAEITSVTFVHDSLLSAATCAPQQAATQTPKTIVTPQGTWQNVTAPSLQQDTLPAVQDFLQMAFETVQRSKNTLHAPTQQQGSAMAPTRATPLTTPPPFKSLQRANSHPNSNYDKPKHQTLLPGNEFKKQTTTEASTSLEQTPSTSEITKAPNFTEPAARSQSYPGYIFYNTTRQNTPKQMLSSPKRSVLVAKRSTPAVTSSDTGTSVQSPASEILLAHLSPKAQNSKQSEKRNTGATRGGPVKQNSSRVPLNFKEVVGERSTNGPQTSQSVKGVQKSEGSHRSWRGHKTTDEEEEIDPKRRVLVSEFPPYTKSQDVIRVLSRFGHCRVDSCRNRLAVVTFDSEAEAASAIRAAEDINIYGEFVEIRPYTNPKHVDELYQAYKKVISTQKNDDITMPSQIDLSGDFFQQLENIQSAIRLTREEVQAATNLYVDLELVLQQEWPGCVAIPFGSIPAGLGIKSSDADCFVQLAGSAAGRARGAAAFVTRARRLLTYYPKVFTHLVAIPRANTPIVKFRHVPSGFHCDVSAKTPLGAQNSKLIKLLLEHDARLAQVAVLLKYWAKVHELSGTGRLTNYALTMMLIFYLQQPAVALVPAVERLQRDPASRYVVDHWDAGFSPHLLPAAPNPPPLPDLLGGFFTFYANFDFDKRVVCPYLGVAVEKAAFESVQALPPEFARYVGNVRDNLASPIRYGTAFCVQDPFEQSHNVASSVCVKLAAEIKAYIKYAADTFAADRDNHYRNFLRTILLTRPKPWELVTPATQVRLLPRQRGHISDPDWRAIVRKTLLEVIFEKILNIRLKEEMEGKKEGGRRANKYDIERYSGTATKPVWRRRKAQLQAALEGRELVVRQAALTDAISCNPSMAPLEFQLEMWYRDEPRNCSLTCRMIKGDIDAFRQFVTFIHTFMMDWFRALLRPHLGPPLERPAAAPVRSVEPKRKPSPPHLVLDPTEITQELEAVTLDTSSESSESKKELR